MDLGIPNIFLTNQELLKNSWYFPKFLTIPDIPNKVDTYGFIVLVSNANGVVLVSNAYLWFPMLMGLLINQGRFVERVS